MVVLQILDPDMQRKVQQAADVVRGATGQLWETMRDAHGFCIVNGDDLPGPLREIYPFGIVAQDKGRPEQRYEKSVIGGTFSVGRSEYRALWALPPLYRQGHLAQAD